MSNPDQSDGDGFQARPGGINVRGMSWQETAEVMEEVKNKQENKQRVLEPMTEIALGSFNPTPLVAGAPDTCAISEFNWTHMPRAPQYRCAVQENRTVDQGRTNVRVLKQNAFNSSRIRDLVLDEHLMTEMARLWAAPNSPDAHVRRLPSDRLKCARPPNRDLKSEALYFMRHTSLPSDVSPRNPFGESAVDEIDAGSLPQYHCDRHSAMKLCGNMGNGGLEGSSIVLFHVGLNNHNHGTLDPNFNKLVSVLAQCLYSPELPNTTTLIPAISTQYTETQSSNKKVFNMMRMAMEGCPAERTRIYDYAQSRDMNPEWLQRVAEYRKSKDMLPVDFTYDHTNIIPKTSQINNPNLKPEDRIMSDEGLQITDKCDKFGLFKACVFVALYPAVDQDGCTQYLQLSALRIRSLPFADPIVALQQLCMASIADSELSEPLLNVVRDMAAVLELPDQNISITSLFDTSHVTNAATIMGEENLMKAVFMKARQLNLSDIDVGGRRMDVTCEREMELYEKYCTAAQQARLDNWRYIDKKVTHALTHCGSLKEAQIGETVSNIVHFDGFVFVSIPKPDFHHIIKCHVMREMNINGDPRDVPDHITDDNIKAEFLERVREIDQQQGLIDLVRRKEVQHSLCSLEPVPQLYADNNNYYKIVGSQSFFNHGVIVAIDTMAVTQFKESKAGNKIHTNVAAGVFLPLRTTSLLMDLYFDNELSFEFLLDKNDHVLDEMYMKERMAKLPPDLLKIYHSIQQWRTKMKDPTHSKCKKRILQQTILSFCGRLGPHPIQDQIKSIRNNAELSAQHNLLLHTSRQTIRKAIFAIANGPMLQFQRSAETMLHIKEISMDSSIGPENGFIDFHANWRGYRDTQTAEWYSRVQLERREYMNFEAISIDFQNRFWQEQDLDVHFQNSLALDSIHNSLIAMFVGMDFQATGTVMYMMDMAGTVKVRVKDKSGRMEMYMCKSPGCGADLSAAVASMVNNVFSAHLLRDSILVSFYNSPESMDKSYKYITTLRLHCLLGSAVMSGENGNFDPLDPGPNEFGQAGAATEALKAGAANKESSQLQIFTEIECRGGNPTSDKLSLANQSYESSQNMLQKRPIMLNDCSALFFMATNIQNNAIPESIQNGSRGFFVFSSSPDTAGRIDQDDFDSPIVDRDCDVTMEVQEMEEDVVNTLGYHFLSERTRSSLKEIDRNMTRAGCIGYFVMWELRRVFPFVHRHMMLHYQVRQLTWTTLQTLIHSIQEMTQGTWRYHLDEAAFHRNANASYKTVTYISSHFKTLVWESVLMRCNAPTIDKAGEPCVDINTAFEDALLACMYQPPSITTMLGSMALWLSTQMLDMQLVILSQLCLYTMGFQQSCPLQVLALVARHGIASLTPRQRQQYYYIADKVIDMTCRKPSTNRSCQNAKDKTVREGNRHIFGVSESSASMYGDKQTARTDIKCELLRTKSFEPIQRDGSCKLAFEQLLGPEKEQHWSHYKAIESNTTGSNAFTTFCTVKMPDKKDTPNKMPSNAITHMPAWLPFVTQTLNQSRRSANFLPIDSYDDVVAEMYADSMTSQRCLERSQEGNPMPSTDAFWKAAYKGCKLPLPKNVSTDRRDLDFNKPSETGAWYSNVINSSSKNKCGVTQAFLAMCGLSDSNSRFDIMNRLFAERLLQRYPGGKMIFPCSSAWMERVGSTEVKDGKTGTQKFKIGNRLHVWQTDTHKKETAIEACCGMDVLWMVIAQALYLAEWKVPSKKKAEQVVHCRVLSQAVATKMSLFMHTCLDQSSVPANGGILHLRMSNPFLRKFKKDSMEIVFDKRLHVEMQQDPQTILSHRHRKRENIHIIKDKKDSSRRCLVYKQQQEEAKSKAHSVSDMPLVPMEACTHMLSHYYEYRTAEAHLRHQHPEIYEDNNHGLRVQSNLATAIRIVASNMFTSGKPRGVEGSMFMRVTPTYVLTCSEDVEMPFVSTKYLYLCVLRTLDDGTFVIESCACDSDTSMNDQYETFKPMPIAPDEKLIFQQEQFAFAVSNGLRHSRHQLVHARTPEQVDGKSGVAREQLEENVEEVLGLMPFPVFAWPQLVIISLRGASCTFTDYSRKRKDDQKSLDTIQLMMESCENMFTQDQCDLFHIQNTAWLQHNRDIPAFESHKTLHVFRSHKPSPFGQQWRWVGFTNAAIENKDQFKHPELAAILHSDGMECAGKIYHLTPEQWEETAELHGESLLRNLHHQHYVITPSGYWVPEFVSDERMYFWLTWEEEYEGLPQPRYLYFQSRESLKHYALQGDGVNPDWTCHHTLFVTNAGARLRAEKTQNGFKVVEFKYIEDDFYTLSRKQDECMDAITEYSKKLNESILKNQPNNQKQCELKIEKYTRELDDAQKALALSMPKQIIIAEYEQRDRSIIQSEPRMCGVGGDCSATLCSTVGILRPHSNRQYMRGGHYRIEYSLPDEEEQMTTQTCELDFVSASYGMVPEGKLIFIALDRELYISIMKSCNGACLLNESNHRRILDGSLDVALACYYTLNSAKDAPLLDSYITVMVEVHIMVDEEDKNYEFLQHDSASKLLIQVPLFDANNRLRISLADAVASKIDKRIKVVDFNALGAFKHEEPRPVEWNLCRKTWEHDSYCEHEDDLSKLQTTEDRCKVINLNPKRSG